MQLSSTLRYLAYPANLASVLFVVPASILFAIAVKVGVFGVPLALIMLTWFFKYGLITVEHVAWQVEGEPVLEVEMLNPIEQRKSFVLLLVTGELFALMWAAQFWLGTLAGAIIGLLAIAVLPVVVVVQTARDAALVALNPLEWYRAIRWLKTDYLQVLVSIFVYWVLAFALVATPVGAAVPLFIRVALLMFGWLAVLALLGGAILERRLADPDDSPMERADIEVPAAEIERKRQRKMDSIYGEWRSGAQKNAWQTLMREADSAEDPIEELRWMHERISAWPEPKLAARVAQELVPRLITSSRYGEAIALTRQHLAADPEYRPVTAFETLRMVRIARDGGDRPTARALLRDFQRIFPNDPLQSAAQDLVQQLQR